MKKKLYKEKRKQIGYLLQHERKCNKLEQEDIARVLGARQELISKIEAGNRRIDIPELIDYAEALGFSITEFAWKIETYLSAFKLLPPPKSNLLGKKIRVSVSWGDNKFKASLGDVLPGTYAFSANTFAELQIEIEKGLVNKEYEFEYKFLDVRSLLNAYSPYISLAAISRVSGINQNQLSQYANGLRKARPIQMKRIMETIHKIGKELTAVVV